MKRIIATIITIIALALPSGASASTWTVDPDHSNLGFRIQHFMISYVNGNFRKYTGTFALNDRDITKSKVEFTIDANSINTNVAKRDEHLRTADFFDVAQFPTIKFVSKKVTEVGKDTLQVTGDLTLRGVTREVTLNFEGLSKEIKDPWGNIRKGATASTKLNRMDFGLAWNKPLETGGVFIGEEVLINLDIEMIKAKDA
jgi:polyisoprenoid-binding protein YceI